MTWDDPSGEKETLSHTYMNLTEQEIMLDHFDFNSEFECTATQANYFNKSGLLFDSFNSGDYKLLQKKLAQNALSSKKRIELEDTAALQNLSIRELEILAKEDEENVEDKKTSEQAISSGLKLTATHCRRCT